MDPRSGSLSNFTDFRILITFSSHVRTMNRVVLGAGHGLTVTLEIRHFVIPGGFVRACARREHPPSSASHFSTTIISGCHDRPARAFLLRIPSSFNSPTRRPYWISPRPLLVVLAFSRAHASLCRKRFIILVILSIDASIVVYCAELEATYLLVLAHLPPFASNFFSLAHAIKRSVNYRS